MTGYRRGRLKLPTTTLGRCIIIELRRRKISEAIERFEHEDDAELQELRGRLLRWSTDNQDALRDANPSMPQAFDNRVQPVVQSALDGAA